MSNYDKALEYSKEGYSIIPLWNEKEIKKDQNKLNTIVNTINKKTNNTNKRNELLEKKIIQVCKSPLNISWSKYQKEKPTKDEVKAWFTIHPDANIGMVTGALSGITVIDLDTREAIDNARHAGLLDNNPVVKTGKGYHIYFQYTDHESAKNGPRNELGLDIRNDGGYIVLPPSIHGSGKKYEWLEGQSIFDIGLKPFPIEYMIEQKRTHPQKKKPKAPNKHNNDTTFTLNNFQNIIDRFNLSPDAISLVLDGNQGRYPSRSEADMAVACHLLSCGANDFDIIEIFKNYPIGEKYRTNNDPNKYLLHTIKRAKELSNLTPEEMSNPLFTSKSITKHDRGYSLDIVNFQEYVCDKTKLKLNIENQGLYRYNGTHYMPSDKRDVNTVSQNILRHHRNLFRPKELKEFLHFMSSNSSIITKDDIDNGRPYACFNNCMLNIDTLTKKTHTDAVFTTSIFDYDFDPEADCPRFKRFLREVFENDESKIRFIQEAAGYCLHRGLPIPALIFMVGNGCNGKSVLLDVLISLFGSDNVANVNLSELSDEKMIFTLVDKMMNVSPESPTDRRIDTDKIKSVASGDLVTGRAIYSDPYVFRPYAKHFIAMNEFPIIQDKSHGMSRRVFVVEFNRTFTGKEIDTGLAKKLKKELPGIFNFVLEGYKRMRDNGFVFENGKTFQNVAKDALHQGDPVKTFIEGYFAKNKVERARWSDAYSSYEGNNQFVLKRKDLKEKLISFGYKVGNSSKDGNNVIVWNRQD